jgi:hypothetical protein
VIFPESRISAQKQDTRAILLKIELVRVSCIQNTQIRGETIAKVFGKVDTFLDVSAILHESIFRMDQGIDLVRLSINATTMSNRATILCNFIKPCASPRPPLRHAAESHHRLRGRCNSLRLKAPPASTSLKNDAPMGENDAARYHRSIRVTRV